VTSGEENGTSGQRAQMRWPPNVWLAVLPVALVVGLVNSTSDYLDMRRSEIDFVGWEPFVWQFSSVAVVIALAPLIGWAVRRWPFSRDNWVRPALVHFALTLPFSAVHIVAMVALRNLVYWAAGARYGFFDDGVALVLVYEWRKDVLTYAAIAAFYWTIDYIRSRRAAASEAARSGASDERIEVRDGGGAVFLPPQDILFVEAAGNYVEFHAAGRTHLVRGTLASWEARLAARGFVRVHRSRLVNRARVASIKPTPSGDIEIMLDDGRALAGSRRFRAGLGA
jgi:hypothetical protein